MGPASEYVELLDVTGETTTLKLRHSKRRWMWAAVGLVLLVAIGFAVEHWQTLKFLGRDRAAKEWQG